MTSDKSVSRGHVATTSQGKYLKTREANQNAFTAFCVPVSWASNENCNVVAVTMKIKVVSFRFQTSPPHAILTV
jgi:hypothetical protein